MKPQTSLADEGGEIISKASKSSASGFQGRAATSGKNTAAAARVQSAANRK